MKEGKGRKEKMISFAKLNKTVAETFSFTCGLANVSDVGVIVEKLS